MKSQEETIMAMGNTGTVNITPEMMKNALSAIEDYRT
jgi:hypothetical protein